MKLTVAVPCLSRAGEAIYREGLGKFLGFLTTGMLEYNPELEIELWTFSQGIEGLKILFENQLKLENCRIKIINDYEFYKKSHNYRKKIASGRNEEDIRKTYEGRKIPIQNKSLFRKLLERMSLTQRKYLLKAIRSESNADYVFYYSVGFIPLLSIRKPTLVQIHDLFTMQYEKQFASNSIWYLVANRILSFSLGLQGLCGAHFVSSSYNTRNNQVLRYIPFINKSRTHIIRFPAMIKDYSGKVDLSKEEFCKKYKISKVFIAYPTQNRPNKNIITLLKAIKLLKNEGIDIQLVITGSFGSVKECKCFIDENPDICDSLIETGNLSEEELYLLYKYSDMVVSTSFVEGASISGQVLEALKIGGIPVVHALSDGIDEWLAVHGFTRITADMNWFKRFDYVRLADLIKDVLSNREKHIEKQMHIFKDINEPSWKETGKKYLKLFSKII